jgi:curved DNA-binding protein CbpA
MAHRITLYDTLGVERDASEEDIRAAFRRLSMMNHPDRFGGDQRAAAEERFQGITEAFNVLSRPESREKYDKELAVHGGGGAGGGNHLDSREIARRLTAKGVEAYRGGNAQEAIEHLQLAIDHDDAADRAHYFMGFVLCQVPGRERDALRHLERAVTLDPHNATYKGQAAVAALGVGMTTRAERLAQDSLALDPTNKKASAVMAKLGTTSASGANGLLGKLRRKG